MNTADNRDVVGDYRATSLRKPDYKKKLEQLSRRSNLGNRDVADRQPSYVERVQAVTEQEETGSATVQSVLVAALQAVHRVLQCERQAVQASISLGQGEKLQQMIASLEATEQALRESLTEQGAKMLDLTLKKGPLAAGSDKEHPWAAALSCILLTLEEDIDWIISLVARQPKGSPGRTISGIVVHLLHHHYNQVLAETEAASGIDGRR